VPAEQPSIEPGVRGRDDDRLGLLVRMPYTTQHDELHARLKALPAADRYWWPERNAWWIADPYLEGVRDILLRYWPSINLLGRDGEPDLLVDRTGTASVQERLAL
jgi:hypothetical protein